MYYMSYIKRHVRKRNQKYFLDQSDASFSAGAGDTVGFVTVSQRLDPSAEDSAASTNAGVSASFGDIDLVKGASE